MNWQKCQRKWLWLKLKYYHRINWGVEDKLWKKPQLEQLMSQPRFKLNSSWIEVRSITTSANLLTLMKMIIITDLFRNKPINSIFFPEPLRVALMINKFLVILSLTRSKISMFQTLWCSTFTYCRISACSVGNKVITDRSSKLLDRALFNFWCKTLSAMETGTMATKSLRVSAKSCR